MTIAQKKPSKAVVQVLACLFALVVAMPFAVAAQEDAQEDALEAGFKQPPPEARPRVWWHWMNGNITRDGIARDLEWMQRIGIGGVQNFDAAMETPVVVDQRLVYMSPQWKEAFSFAVGKAAELDLEFAIASSAGWSLTGGPWVSPQDAMKKLVWSETALVGGEPVDQVLPPPPAIPGPYQSLPASYKHGHNAEVIPDAFYRDAAVLAYPMPPASSVVLPEQMTVNGVSVDAALLSNGDLATGIELPAENGQSPGAIDIVYAQPVTIQSTVMYIANLPADVMRGPLKPTLQAQASDGTWQSITRFTLGAVPATASFPAVTARQFRLLFTRGEPRGNFNFAPAPGIDLSGLASLASSSPQQPLLTDLRLGTQPKIHAFERKAGFALVDDYHQLDGTEKDANKDDGSLDTRGIDPAAVLDLTGLMDADGRLQWDAPPGDWKILRLGYSLTGKTNSPATAEATGLEVDKFDSDAVERYLDTYLGMYEDVVGEGQMGARGLSALLTDSTEAGPANWTPQLVAHFQRLRGYDPTPWLPALTGDIVGSRQQSNRFLYDFRHTLAQLNATEHYGTVARIAHARDLAVYGESLEGNRLVSTLGDDLEMRRFADIPMAAMWSYGKGGAPAPQYIADMRGAASVAHVYGKPIAAAESLTSIMAPWAHAPADLQPMIDAEFLSGINRPVIHTSVHQPVDEKVPGLSLHVFGQYFTRHDTWADMAKPWIDYLSRNSFLLQQGHNVADVAYFYGEEPPLGVLAASQGFPADVPSRYAYDFIPPDAILNELTVEDGDLVTRGGARYKLLYLGGSSRDFMTLPLLRRLAELVAQGATLVGEPPYASPSLADDQGAFSELVNQLWKGAPVSNVGRGRVIAGADVEAALARIGVAADVDVSSVVATGPGSDAATADPAAAIQFVHRRVGDDDIYFIANRGEARAFDARFRVAGKAPEIWRADSAAIAPASYRADADGTVVPLSMGAWESYFVVFRRPATAPSLTVEAIALAPLVTLDGPWHVSFQGNRGAPEQAVFTALASLAEHDDPGIRYFSGVASYRTEFVVPEKSRHAGAMQLALGAVGDVAEVFVNGQYAGTAWKPPYTVDVGPYVRSGTNQLEIRVANLWVNRLIGDRQPDMEPVTYTTFKTYMPNAPLRPSGLIGPVELRVAQGAGN